MKDMYEIKNQVWNQIRGRVVGQVWNQTKAQVRQQVVRDMRHEKYESDQI